jgi:hypothetical protein
MALLTADQVRAILRKEVKRAGSQAAWARKYGIEPAFVSHALSGSRLPTRRLLKALKLKKVPAYERAEEVQTDPLPGREPSRHPDH